MVNLLKFIIYFMEKIQLFFKGIVDTNHLNIDDKMLHFYVFGFLCLFIYIVVHFAFKRIAKYNLKIISWFYTLTVAIVLAFAIEVGQKASNSGHMEFGDIAYGIYGFLVFYMIFQFFAWILRRIIKSYRKSHPQEPRNI